MRASFVTAVEDIPDEQRTIAGLLRLLWRHTSDPRMGGVWEVYLAARTDPSTQAAIEPVVRDHVKAIRRILRDEVGDRFGVPNERVLKLANLVSLGRVETISSGESCEVSVSL